MSHHKDSAKNLCDVTKKDDTKKVNTMRSRDKQCRQEHNKYCVFVKNINTVSNRSK